MYPYLVEWCNRKNVDIKENNEISTFTTHTAADIQALIDSYDISITPRDYQFEAFKFALENERGLILSPTASGKSLIAYMLIRHYLNVIDNNILIIVPTTSLVEQLYKDFKSYGYDVENNVSRNYHGYEIEDDKRIVISTWQSLYKLPNTFSLTLVL